MARYLSTQYNNKVTNNQRNKKGGRNSKKGEDSKPEDSNTTTSGTAGAHIEGTTPQDSTAPSEGASIGVHVSETSQRTFRPAWSVEELLAAHPVDDAIWIHTNPSDVSIDTVKSA